MQEQHITQTGAHRPDAAWLRKTAPAYLLITAGISLCFSLASGAVKAASGLSQVESGFFAEWVAFLEGTPVNEAAIALGWLIPPLPVWNSAYSISQGSGYG